MLLQEADICLKTFDRYLRTLKSYVRNKSRPRVRLQKDILQRNA